MAARSRSRKRVKKSKKMQKFKPKLVLDFRGMLSFLILHELSLKPLSGDELAFKIGLRRGKPLTPGTIYPTLKRLKKHKLLHLKRFGRRKVYSLTPAGKQELNVLYKLFGLYFAGLKKYVLAKPPKLERKKSKARKQKTKQRSSRKLKK